jgi:hypothetical protein
LNSFNLTTPLYNRIGLYLHPYAALINHSCSYNAVIGFDGDELFVKAIRPIKADEQVFISYIDATNPPAIRRTELAERYFFDCRCPKCTNEVGLDDKPVLTASLDLVASEPAVNRAVELMNSPSKDDSPSAAVNILNSAVSVLRRTSASAITHQPHAALLDELIVSMLSARRFYSAFAQATLRYLRINPVIYPEFSHPIRQLHAWGFARLGIHISQGVNNCPEEKFPLHRFNLNFGLIIWSVLFQLVGRIEEVCIVPSFKGKAKKAFKEVYSEFKRNELEPSTMMKDIEAEWGKLEEVADYVLQPE